MVISEVENMSGAEATADAAALNKLIADASKAADVLGERFAGGEATGEGAGACRSAGRDLAESIGTDSQLAQVTGEAMTRAATVVGATADDVELLRELKRAMKTMPEKTIEIRDSYVRWMNYVYTDPMTEIGNSADILTDPWLPYTAVIDGTAPVSSTGNNAVPVINTTQRTPGASVPFPDNTTTTSRTTTDPTGTRTTTTTDTPQSPVDRNRTTTDPSSTDNRTTNRDTSASVDNANDTVPQTNQNRHDDTRTVGPPAADRPDSPTTTYRTDRDLAGVVPYTGLNLPSGPTGSPMGTPTGGPRITGGPSTTLSPRSITGASPTASTQTVTGPASTGARPTTGPMSSGARAAGSRDDTKEHKAAHYLHTTDNGAELVGPMPLVAPPVLGDWAPSGHEATAADDSGSGPGKT